MRLPPFTDNELLSAYRGGGASSLHLLTWYSLVIGTSARIVIDLGVGNSTRVARAAVQVTGGVVYSCDSDRERFASWEQESSPDWRFYCLPSLEFLAHVPDPVDVVFHDASHEYEIVHSDLLALFPKMRQFGMIAIHDTQQPRYRLLEAVTDAIASAPNYDISLTTFPFGSGLSVLRMETAVQPPVIPAGQFKGERLVTVPRAHPK